MRLPVARRAHRRALGALLVVVVLGIPGSSGRAGARPAPVFRGACYCRLEGRLECVEGLTERECRVRADELICDDWFWLERHPCWNWGYGG
jgi:hypothetical protein